MTVARKVFTEAMIRKNLKAHYEIEPELGIVPETDTICICMWSGSNFEDHFIDQLHKLWHEMFGSRPSSPPLPQPIPESNEELVMADSWLTPKP